MMPFKLSLVIYLLCFITSNSTLAGTISIQGSPKIQFELKGEIVTISGHVELVNLGDERALDVFPQLQIGSWGWTGNAYNLDPNEKHRWKINTKTPLSEWHCKEKHCKNFQLPLIGSYPMEFYRHYNDMNGYPFSSMIIESIFIGAKTAQSLKLPLQGQLQITSYGKNFTAKLSLENLSTEDLEVAVTFKSTKAISIPEGQGKVLHIDPHTKSSLTFHGEMRKALLNSWHDIFAVVSSKAKTTLQNKDGKEELRGLKTFSSQYHIIKSKKGTYYWILGVLGALIFNILIVRINNKQHSTE